MSLLLGPDGPKADAFATVEDVAALSLAEKPVIVPLTVIDEALKNAKGAPVGLFLDNNADVEAARAYIDAVALIAIGFPSFGDGRGLSLARRLRRLGFRGVLRARGPLIADQYIEALACGFDEIELPDEMAARQPPDQWINAKSIVTTLYQSGYGEGQSILQKRLAAGKEAS